MLTLIKKNVLVYCGRNVSSITNQFIRKKNNWYKDGKTACSVKFCRWKFENVDIDDEICWLPFKVTKEIRLGIFQWKVIHAIYPTHILLCKMGKPANSNCRYCNEKYFLDHFFWTCPAVQLIWALVENRMSVILDIENTTSVTERLFGLGYSLQISLNKLSEY